jgi:hypothetical protein
MPVTYADDGVAVGDGVADGVGVGDGGGVGTGVAVGVAVGVGVAVAVGEGIGAVAVGVGVGVGETVGVGVGLGLGLASTPGGFAKNASARLRATRAASTRGTPANDWANADLRQTARLRRLVQTAAVAHAATVERPLPAIAEDTMDRKAKTPKKPKSAKAKGTKGA